MQSASTRQSSSPSQSFPPFRAHGVVVATETCPACPPDKCRPCSRHVIGDIEIDTAALDVPAHPGWQAKSKTPAPHVSAAQSFTSSKIDVVVHRHDGARAVTLKLGGRDWPGWGGASKF